MALSTHFQNNTAASKEFFLILITQYRRTMQVFCATSLQFVMLDTIYSNAQDGIVICHFHSSQD